MKELCTKKRIDRKLSHRHPVFRMILDDQLELCAENERICIKHKFTHLGKIQFIKESHGIRGLKGPLIKAASQSAQYVSMYCKCTVIMCSVH